MPLQNDTRFSIDWTALVAALRVRLPPRVLLTAEEDVRRMNATG